MYFLKKRTNMTTTKKNNQLKTIRNDDIHN